jgi:hypothetical protein
MSYKTGLGFVQFDPRDGEAAGKKVRNIVVNSVGGVQLSCTLWPSHAGFEVAKGDLVALEGKYDKRPGTKDGEPITYHNISVTRIANLGKADEGVRVDVEENEVTDEPADDEIPF